MRERSTWNRNEIARTASHGKRAEDPRAMNQDHLKQQPAADAYTTGGPSEFGEDVHPSAGTWKAEYSGGEVSRNEIGMPEIRKDTFNHPEKTAAMDDEAILKKANLCTKIARGMLRKNASDTLVEEQALALMHMPDAALIETANRLANQGQDDQGQDDQGQNKQGASAIQGQDDDQGQDDQGQNKQAKDAKDADDQEGQGQQAQDKEAAKRAGQIPPQFKEQIEKKKEESKGKDKDDEGQGKNKQGSAGAMFIAALKSGNGQGVEQALAAMMSQAFQQMGQGNQEQKEAIIGLGGQGQNQQQMAQGQNQQQMAQGQNQQQPMAQQTQQQPMAQGQNQQTMSDDQLLDQMLQDDLGQPQQMMGGAGTMMTAESEIQLEANTMDVGEVSLDSGDAVLNSLFASNSEYQNAAEAHALQNGGQRPPVTASAPMTRTAATRTVGTRPTAGVSQIGGGIAGGNSGGSDVDKLSGLWQSAPDVSNVFR